MNNLDRVMSLVLRSAHVLLSTSTVPCHTSHKSDLANVLVLRININNFLIIFMMMIISCQLTLKLLPSPSHISMQRWYLPFLFNNIPLGMQTLQFSNFPNFLQFHFFSNSNFYSITLHLNMCKNTIR